MSPQGMAVVTEVKFIKPVAFSDYMLDSTLVVADEPRISKVAYGNNGVFLTIEGISEAGKPERLLVPLSNVAYILEA